MSNINLVEKIDNTKLAEEVVANAYVELATYTAKTRNYPGLLDGMKMVYRRLIYQSRGYKSRVKSPTLVGDLIKIHPHSDESGYSVLVECTCKYGHFPLFVGQGNFGGLGFGPSSSRYTEAYLSDIARLMYLDLIDYAEYEEGEVGELEPKALPALIPYVFLAGCSGFSVGMAAPNIAPYNCMDLVNYYIDLLEGRETKLPSPDYGAVILNCNKTDHSDALLNSGSGTLWFEPLIIQEDYNKLVVTEITPKSGIHKVNKKLEYAIDQEWVDFIDESDKNGYRFVYVINNFNKISLEEVKSLILKALSCSMSYRLMFEHNSHVYYCNFEFVVNHQLKYLRECVQRKYKDYLEKSEYKSQVYKAINKLRNSEDIVSKLHTMELSELKNIIINWGYSEEVASGVVDKSIRYLTKSHDEEIQKEEESRKIYKEYYDNPDKYLLEKYYQLKDMISDFYKSRTHSVFKNDMSVIDNNKFELSEDHKSITFGLDKSNSWNSVIYNVTKLGYIGLMVVSKLNTSSIDVMQVNDNDEVISLISDNCKYIILIIDGNHIYVVNKTKLWSGLNLVVKLWGNDYPVQAVIGCYDEDIKFIDERNNEHNVHCENWVKSRISKPQYLSRYKLKYYIDKDGNKVEIDYGI